MKIYPDRQAVVLKTRHPGKLLKAMPSAKLLPVNGGKYVGVPHKLEETRFLNNLGARVPSPILHYYDWPGQFEPFEAQKHTAAMLTLNHRAYVLSDVGTGKSMSALWAYDYLRSIGQADKILVVAPLSTLMRTWADEVFYQLPHLKYTILHGTKKQRLKALKREADVLIINHDGVGVILDELMADARITHVVIDEIAHAARNSRTKKWKVLNQLINRGKKPLTCWGMTGTPTPNAPTDAYGQIKLITPSSAPRSYTKFRDMTMRQYGPFKWVPRENAVEIVRDTMAPAVRFTRDECVDLPECMYESRVVPLTAEQSKAYKTMATKLTAEAAEGEILAVNEAVKLNKLVQISVGGAYTTNKTFAQFDATPRLQELEDVINSTEHKVIVYVPFVSTVSLVSEHLRAKGFSCAEVYGEVAKAKRDQIFGAFQKPGGLRILVAQPAAMSHGLTLTKANVIVWYGPTTSNETYEQANGRITRPGQKNKQFIIHLEGTPVEARIYRRLQEKQTMQGLLLDLVKQDCLTEL